ncbi:MAG: hypothetical protein WKF68_14645 [Daejeonella sp.]
MPSTGVLTASGFVSTEPTGLPPFVVASSTVVANLSATNAVNTAITNDVATNLPVYPTFVSGISGNLGHRTASSRLSFVPFTGALTASSFNGPLNGNANSATNVTGIVAIANGGTGAITKALRFDALSPMTTAGDIIYMSPGGTGTRLPVGAATTFLKGGALPNWSSVDLASGDVSGIVPSNKGGTGINNTNTLTLTGSNNITLNAPFLTNVTLPATGTLATLTGTESLTNKTINGNNITAGTGTLTLGTGSTLATSGAFPLTLTSTAPTNVQLPATGTLATLAGIEALSNKTINGNTVTAGTGTLTLSAGSTLTNAGGNSVTLTSTGTTNVTLPTTGTLVAALTGTGTVSFPATATGASSNGITTISVPTAIDNDAVSLGVPSASMLPGYTYVAW